MAEGMVVGGQGSAKRRAGATSVTNGVPSLHLPSTATTTIHLSGCSSPLPWPHTQCDIQLL